MTQSKAFDLISAKLDAAKAEHRRLLNAELFRDGAGIKPRPLTWRERLNARFLRARRYLFTVWMALRGDDPYDW